MKDDEPQNFDRPVPQERAPVGLSLLHHRLCYCPVRSSVTVQCHKLQPGHGPTVQGMCWEVAEETLTPKRSEMLVRANLLVVR